MQFTFTPDDLELIATLEHDYDPETLWADHSARQHLTEQEWKDICARERAFLKRTIRWAIMFRDLPAFDAGIGAGQHNPAAFKEALWEIIFGGDLATEEWEGGRGKQIAEKIDALGPESQRDYERLAAMPPAYYAEDVIFMDRDIENLG